MTILFMGGEMGAFTPSDSNCFENTGNGTYNSDFARCALIAYGSASYNESAAFTATADFWVHFDVYQEAPVSSSTLATVCTLLNGSGTEVFRLQSSNPQTGSATWQLQYWNGSAWTNLGSSFTASPGLTTVDLHIVANSVSGSGTVYLSGTQRSTGTADLSSIASVTKFRGYGKTVGINSYVAISQVIIASDSTIGMRLLSRHPSSAGATSSWTGAYSDIDETTYSDADFILSATANQVSTFAQTGNAISGYTVSAVGVTARAHCGASGPQNLQLALHVSGADYVSSSKALSAGYGAYCNIWETNPATSAAWVNTAVDAIQPGVKSIA